LRLLFDAVNGILVTVYFIEFLIQYLSTLKVLTSSLIKLLFKRRFVSEVVLMIHAGLSGFSCYILVR
jgi:hypothetical protein